MSRRTAESNKAILAAWVKEQELVRAGKGTREWTPEQQQDILEKGKAYDDTGKAFEGQHMKSAEQYPEYQGNPGNIQFLTRTEHLEAHNGNWQNPTNWYFNPVTKDKIDFGDGPFIPCEIIQLHEPIIKIQVLPGNEKDVVHDSAEPTPKSQSDNVNVALSHVNGRSKHRKIASSTSLGFFQNLRHRMKNIGKELIEFPINHPTATKVIKYVGIAVMAVAEVAADSAINNPSNSENNFLQDNSDSNVKKYASNETVDGCFHDENSSEDIKRLYTPNDVPAGKQRYHYKDGSVKWKDKSGYHRDGNNDK